jgi:hypothetical protein
MTIITEVCTYLFGALVSTGREPIDVPDHLAPILDDPTIDAREIDLEERDGMRQTFAIGTGKVQRL